MVLPARKTPANNPIQPYITLQKTGEKLFLPRGSRNRDPRIWAEIHTGPIHEHWKAMAREKGFALVRRVRDKDHVVLRCLACGALTAQKLFTLRTAQPACAACKHKLIEDTAEAAKLTLLGYDPDDRHVGIFRAPCGHQVRRQFELVARIARGICNLRCEQCHTRKEAAEARARGWKLLGDDPEGNPNYRLYQHGCGHCQRVARVNMGTGRFQCSACGQGWSSGKSAIYAIRFTLPTGLKAVKLGFSRDPQSRLQHQLFNKPGIEAELLCSIPQPNGRTALRREKALHRELRSSYPEAIIPPERFREWLSVTTEVYGVEIERIILQRLTAIRND